MASTRLPGKMLLDLGGHPLIWHAWNAAVEAFCPANVVIAVGGESEELRAVCAGFGADVYSWAGDENDVLGRFYHCAHSRRWHPDSVIVRVTPDDPFKSPAMMRRVAAGERLPVEQGGEAFTLAMLDQACNRWSVFGVLRPGDIGWPSQREHLTDAIFETPPPPPPPGQVWTVDTQEDLDAAREKMEGRWKTVKR